MDAEEERSVHANSKNIVFTLYQENLETSMKGSHFTFDSVQMM